MIFDSPAADEYPLIFDSWARSFKKSPWAGCVPNHLWDMVSRAAASDILNRGARVIVAATPIEGADDYARRVMGYSVSEPGVLHWLFVKRDYRDMGVGRALLDETTRDWPKDSVYDAGHPTYKYTHRTRASSGFLKGSGWQWDPVLARVKA